MKFKERFISINGKKISYFDEGSKEKEAVVFLHGWGGSKELYTKLIDKLNPHFRVIILDLPGHGSSEKLGEYSIQEYAKFIRKFVQKIKVEKFNLAGFSIGGRIALTLGIFYPAYIDKIIIWEPAVNLQELRRYKLFNFLLENIRTKKELKKRMYQFLANNKFSKFASGIFGAGTMEAFRRADPDTLVNLAHSLLEKEINKESLNLDKEILIIYGHSEDILVPKKKILELEKILPKAILKEIRGAQHYSRDVSKVYDEILNFLINRKGDDSQTDTIKKLLI